MLDRYKRNINYLRISVTDRCNLRCYYCMPPEGIKLLTHDDILSFKEITEFVKFAVKNGINKVRITGGEPLVRKGLVNLIKDLSLINGINDLSMTTNAILLEKYAQSLADAGLSRVNISLDCIDKDEYKKITGGGDINMAIKGIKAAQKSGLSPIKINCVVNKSSTEKNAKDVAKFCHENNLELRYIHLMDLEKGVYQQVEGGSGGNCNECNRLRLSSTGSLYPCLFSDEKFNIRELGVEQAFIRAIENKPISGCSAKENKFYNIGG